MKRTLSAAMSLMLAAASASAQVPASALTRIGTAAAVRGSVKAVSAESPVGRVVSSGKPLFLNDHVTTDAAGRLQVLLLDETIFTLGPNSDMVLDDFVYDPKTSAGNKITASISKGTFRFVTGKIAAHDPEKLKIKVAVGTIGVRGSIGVGATGPSGTIIINGGARNADNHDDAAGIYAQNGGRTVNLSQPGVGTTISPDGRVADAHFMAAELNRIMGTLQTQVGRSGGQGGEPAGSGKRTATDASGRSTSVGGILASEDQDSANLISTLNSTLVNTVQSINGGAVATWDAVRTINTGTGNYVASAGAFCSGGLCGAGQTGTWDYNMTINFGQQTVNGSIALSIPAASFSDSTTVNPISYAALSGNATRTLVNADVNNTQFAKGTAFTLNDRGGTIAKDMVMTLNYVQGSGVTVTGQAATGSR